MYLSHIPTTTVSVEVMFAKTYLNRASTVFCLWQRWPRHCPLIAFLQFRCQQRLQIAQVRLFLFHRFFGQARKLIAQRGQTQLFGVLLDGRYLLNVRNLEQQPAAKAVDIGVLSRYDRPLPGLDDYERWRSCRATHLA